MVPALPLPVSSSASDACVQVVCVHYESDVCLHVRPACGDVVHIITRSLHGKVESLVQVFLNDMEDEAYGLFGIPLGDGLLRPGDHLRFYLLRQGMTTSPGNANYYLVIRSQGGRDSVQELLSPGPVTKGTGKLPGNLNRSISLIPLRSPLPGRNVTEMLPTTEAFVPDTAHIMILQEVSDSPSCTITHVVEKLLPSQSESVVRSRVRQLLARRYLDWGKSPLGIQLRLTSRGRVALQQAPI
jgi:hypothetical protein